MIKTQKFAKTGALIGGASGLIYNLIKQFQRKNNDPNYQFDWESFFKDVLIGTVGGTAVGAGVGAVTDYRNAQQPTQMG